MLRAPIVDLTRGLERIAANTPGLALVSPMSNSIRADTYDVVVSDSHVDASIRIVDPLCGQPVVDSGTLSDVELSNAHTVVRAFEYRRRTLESVMLGIETILPTFPAPGYRCRIPEIASVCNLHVSTICHALFRKNCRSPDRLIPCRDFTFVRD